MLKDKLYILVHGAWHSSWCWEIVAFKMRALNCRIITPDLPGHGNKKTNFKEVNLKKYVSCIEEIVANVKEKVVLVGHSMAGIVISQLAENMPKKIATLVYVSGFIPDNGGSLSDQEKLAKFPSVSLAAQIKKQEYCIALQENKACELFYNCCQIQDAADAVSRLQDQPLLPFVEAVTISDNFLKVPKVYIECLRDNAIHIQDQRKMHCKISCQIKTIDTDHSPFLSTPDELVDCLRLI
jgi:pimeloyl-ACP methyl ester carboxylesterase